MQKVKKKIFVVLIIIFLPIGVLASIFGEENVTLGAILREIILQGWALDAIRNNSGRQRQILEDQHQGVGDRLDFDLPERFHLLEPDVNFQFDDINDFRWKVGRAYRLIWNLKGIFDVIYRRIPKTVGYEAMLHRDLSAMGAYNFAEDSYGESETFEKNSEKLIEDLKDASEGKATVRGAQAEAIQIQQLARMNSNQALQLKLQAEEILESNRKKKELESSLLGLNRELADAFANLKPAGVP